MSYLTAISLFLFIIHSLSAQAQESHLNEILKQFDRYAEEQRKVWNIPGMAIGIIKGQEVIFAKGYGQRGLSDTRPVNTETIFQIGSLTKAFTAALVAIAEDKHWLKWEDPVIQHLPSFRLFDPWVTTQFQIVDLLAQRSGLPQYAGDGQAFLGFSREEMVHHLQYLQPVSSFRSTYAYQNIFFVIASHILEKKSQLSFEDLLKKEIFFPLEMKNSTTTVQEYLKSENRAEWLMRLENGSVIHLDDHFPYNDWNYILGPAGGINSNVEDMTKWLILQANQGDFKGKQLITKNNMERMTRPMVFMKEAMYYALGWVRMEYSPYPIIWHNGATLGVYNIAAFVPEEKIGIVVLSNVRNTNLSTALTFQFFDLYFDKPSQDWSQKLLSEQQSQAKASEKVPTPHYPPMSLSQYSGFYENPVYGKVEVREDKEQLTLILGKDHLQLTLQPWSRDIFSLIWPLAQDADTKVIFIPDDKGVVNRMEIEVFLKEGAGAFKKILVEES